MASAGPHASLHLAPDNHASTPPLSFLQAGCPSCRPTNSVKALKAQAPKALKSTKFTTVYGFLTNTAKSFRAGVLF